MTSKFSSSFDDLLSDSKRQFDDLSRGTITPREPQRVIRQKTSAKPATVDDKVSVIEGKVGGIDFSFTAKSN